MLMSELFVASGGGSERDLIHVRFSADAVSFLDMLRASKYDL